MINSGGCWCCSAKKSQLQLQCSISAEFPDNFLSLSIAEQVVISARLINGSATDVDWEELVIEIIVGYLGGYLG